MERVWKNSKQEGTRLLVLLALADRAGDDGFCWPSVAEIAQRARVSDRQAQYHLRALEDSGELVSSINRGRTHSNRYVVTVGLTREEAEATIAEKVQPIAPINEEEKAQPAAPITEEKVQCSADKRCNPLHPNRHIEPSIKTSGSTKKKRNGSAGEKQPQSEAELESAWSWIMAVCSVCKLNTCIPAHRGRAGKRGKELAKAGYSIEQLHEYYGPDGWWYRNDWRGKKGQAPTPEQIADTIEQAIAAAPQQIAVTTGDYGGYCPQSGR